MEILNSPIFTFKHLKGVDTEGKILKLFFFNSSINWVNPKHSSLKSRKIITLGIRGDVGKVLTGGLGE